MWFELVTWPGSLAYSGDMGCFVFSRLEDMFEFFRTEYGEGQKLRINPSYWGEKLEAVDRLGHRDSGHREFSEGKLRKHVEDAIKTWVEECDEPYDASDEDVAAAKAAFKAELREAIEEDVYYHFDEGEHEARKAVNDFQRKIGDQTYNFQETWEWDCDDYTYRFIWCCYALAWAIQTYDKASIATPEAALTEVSK